MMRSTHRLPVLAAVFLVAVALLGCSRGKPKPFESVKELKAPSGRGAAQPKFYKDATSQFYMTWVDPAADSLHALRYSRLHDGQWTAPVTVAQGKDWFIHFADLPSMVTLSGGAIVAQWLQLNPTEAAAYDIQVTVSSDGGSTWSGAVKPHKWHKAAQYGMVSMLPFSPDRAFITWLDGRDHPRKTSLRMATVTAQGRVFNNIQLDGEVCDCCPTDAVLVPNGFVVAYRDRSPQNYRDISLVRIIDGLRMKPETVYPDRWRELGCPISGPAIDAVGPKVVVAWYTQARGTSAIEISFSANAGKRFGRAYIVSDDRPRGRVDVAALEDGSAVVCWVAAVSGREQELRVQRVWPDGTVSKKFETVTPAVKGLVGCLPQMARVDDELYFAWTAPSDPTSIRMAVAHIGN